MPDKKNLKLVIGNSIQDLKQIRLPGIDKSFDQLTIGELVQIRPGADVSDTYDCDAFTDNISVNTSAILEELGRIHKIRVMEQVLHQDRLTNLRTEIGRVAGGLISGRDAEKPSPGPQELSLPRPEEDVFSAGAKDPFKA